MEDRRQSTPARLHGADRMRGVLSEVKRNISEISFGGEENEAPSTPVVKRWRSSIATTPRGIHSRSAAGSSDFRYAFLAEQLAKHREHIRELELENESLRKEAAELRTSSRSSDGIPSPLTKLCSDLSAGIENEKADEVTQPSELQRQLQAERAKNRHLQDRVEDLEVQLERARDHIVPSEDRVAETHSPLQLQSVLRALESRRQHALAVGSPASSDMDTLSLGKFFSPENKMPTWGVVSDVPVGTPTTPFARSVTAWPVTTPGSSLDPLPAHKEEPDTDRAWARIASAFQDESTAPHRVLTELFRDGILSPHALVPTEHVPMQPSSGAECDPWHAAVLAGWIAPESPLLHIAVVMNHKRATKAVLRAGVNINALDRKERTALDVATEAGHDGLAAYLASKGASSAKNAEKSAENTMPPITPTPFPTKPRLVDGGPMFAEGTGVTRALTFTEETGIGV